MYKHGHSGRNLAVLVSLSSAVVNVETPPGPRNAWQSILLGCYQSPPSYAADLFRYGPRDSREE